MNALLLAHMEALIMEDSKPQATLGKQWTIEQIGAKYKIEVYDISALYVIDYMRRRGITSLNGFRLVNIDNGKDYDAFRLYYS